MRALIVDDERLARNELRRLLGHHPEVEVVGEAPNAAQARQACRVLAPELLFLDLQLPGESGFELLASLDCRPRVVFITAHDEYALQAFEVSASDYLVKPIDPRRLALAVGRLCPRPSAAGGELPVAGTASGTTTRRLCELVGEELCGGDVRGEHLAARLHMSARTLHRRLAGEGETLRSVVGAVRLDLARRHLREGRLPIVEIAFLLGFSEASAFHRAFRRWTGWAPLAYRHAHGSRVEAAGSA